MFETLACPVVRNPLFEDMYSAPLYTECTRIGLGSLIASLFSSEFFPGW